MKLFCTPEEWGGCIYIVPKSKINDFIRDMRALGADWTHCRAADMVPLYDNLRQNFARGVLSIDDDTDDYLDSRIRPLYENYTEFARQVRGLAREIIAEYGDDARCKSC